MAEWTGHALIMIVLISGIAVWRAEIRRLRQIEKLVEELTADAFSVGYMSEDDRNRLSKSRLIHRLVDKDLPKLHNSIRIAKLKESLELVAAGEEDHLFDQTFDEISFFDLNTILSALLPLLDFMGLLLPGIQHFGFSCWILFCLGRCFLFFSSNTVLVVIYTSYALSVHE